MGMRFVLAAILLAWFVPLPRGHFWTLCWISFIAATLQYGLTFSGLALMAATPAVLLVQSEVIFGVIIAALLLGERPSLRQMIGIVMASCGVVVILGAPALDGQWLGIGLVLSGALVWAFGQVLIRRLDGALGGFQLTAKGKGSPNDWKLYKAEFGYASDDDAKAKSLQAAEGLLPAIKAGVFLISCHGTADKTVPFEDNAAHVIKLWQDNGGRVKLFPKEGGDHHPHGLPDSAPLIEVLTAEAK